MRAVGHGDRRSRLLAGIRPDALVIEVGASYLPLVPKREGWRTTTVDHDTAEALRAKYADAAVDRDRIEEVDVVWRGGDLHARFEAARHGTYDALVISHVLEHLPDPLAFLASADILLKPDGVIVMAVPDKRFCFDAYRWPATAGGMLQAHLERRRTHAPGCLFDEVAYSVTRAGQTIWSHDFAGPGPVPFHPPDRARGLFDHAARTPADYIDCHAWQFTPASLELLFLDLELAGATAWVVSWLEPRESGEILAHLRRRRDREGERPDALQRKRMELLRATMRELAEGAAALS